MQEIDYEEGKRLTDTHVCAECGSLLVLPWGGAFNIEGYVIMCALHPEHQGFKQQTSLTRAHRQGVPVPSYIESAIVKRSLPTNELSTMLNMVAVKYPQADFDTPSAALFILDCLRLDLDPLLGEIVPISFKGKGGKKVITPIITESGYLSMAARACPNLWQGPPNVKPVTDAAMKEAICGNVEAWVWEATGRTAAMEPGQYTTTYGWVTPDEIEKEDWKKTPKDKLPGNQARVRAVKRWIRENFPEAMALMKQATADWMGQAEGVGKALEFIDAEYQVLEPNGAPTAPPPASTTRGPNQLTEAQGKKIYAQIKNLGLNVDEMRDTIAKRFSVANFDDISKAQASIVIEEMTKLEAGHQDPGRADKNKML